MYKYLAKLAIKGIWKYAHNYAKICKEINAKRSILKKEEIKEEEKVIEKLEEEKEPI